MVMLLIMNSLPKTWSTIWSVTDLVDAVAVVGDMVEARQGGECSGGASGSRLLNVDEGVWD